MANYYKGFNPYRYADGNPWNGAATLYCIPSTDGSAFYIGDAVKSAAGSDADGISYVQKAAAGDTVRGVVVGVRVSDPGVSLQGTSLSLETISIPATKARAYYVYVADDPNVLFTMLDDSGVYPGGTTAANQRLAANKNANFTVATPSQGQHSATVLAAATIATTNTLPLKIFGFVQSPDNLVDGSAARRLIVKFNTHELLGSTAGV